METSKYGERADRDPRVAKQGLPVTTTQGCCQWLSGTIHRADGKQEPRTIHLCSLCQRTIHDWHATNESCRYTKQTLTGTCGSTSRSTSDGWNVVIQTCIGTRRQLPCLSRLLFETSRKQHPSSISCERDVDRRHTFRIISSYPSRKTPDLEVFPCGVHCQTLP